MDELLRQFEGIFGPGDRPMAVRAPGRVNLIGEHTDYNDGLVLPIAIDRQITALVRRRADRQVVIRSTMAEAAGEVRFDLDGPISRGEPEWGNYCRGVAAGLLARGEALAGAEILLDSTISRGAGLSSSAALEVATALVLQWAAGRLGAVPAGELARLCQRAEHEYAGAPCGIMDQSVCIMARPGAALLLDCRSGQTRHVPFDDPDVVLLVCDTQVRHAISGTGYASRRRQCESAAARLGVPALRDATDAIAGACPGLTDVERRRVRHVVGEIDRTRRAVAALEAGDHVAFGKLMVASHVSLRDDYDVSCPELDAIVATAMAQGGVFGARLTGGGFGGSAIVLARRDRASAVTAGIGADFAGRFGRTCPVFATRAAGGAGLLSALE